MKILEDTKLDFKDVLIRPKRSELGSRNEVDLERDILFKHSGLKWRGVPIVASNMDTIGTFEMYRVLSKYKMITCLHKFYNIDDYPLDLDPNYYMISIGVKDEDYQKLEILVKKLDPYFVCIDVANGYSTKFLDFIKRVHQNFPKLTICAGNVVTNEMVEELILNCGVDVVKIGIGSSGVCTTRVQTGVGMPQLSSIIECSDASHGISGQIMSDGGITCPGDVAKAFGAGADFVMCGSLFSGHDESGGEKKNIDGIEYKIFYGMSSETAMKRHYGGMADYRSSEGRTVKVPYKGPVEDTVRSILGGIRSTCTYIGARKLKDIPKCTTFLKVNRQINDSFVKDEIPKN